MKKTKLPTDTNKKAFSIVELATSEDKELNDEEQLKAAASLLGRKGGLKGGKARAKSMTPEKRSEIAKKAAAKRWAK